MNDNLQITTTKNNPISAIFSLENSLFIGINPLISLATPLICMIVAIRKLNYLNQTKVTDLQHILIKEIKEFLEKSYLLECDQRLVLSAGYCLCTALDETVLAMPWGNQSSWSHTTLLSIFQKETWGGERFFIILEEASKSPQQQRYLLELIYIILSLGFEGKYYNQTQDVRDEIRHKLYHLIIKNSDIVDDKLNPIIAKTSEQIIKTNTNLSTLKITYLIIVSLVTVAIFFNMLTGFNSKHIFLDLNNMTQDL